MVKLATSGSSVPAPLPPAGAFLSAKCKVVETPDKGGHAVVTREAIDKDELIAVWSGRTILGAEIDTVNEKLRHRIVQVEEDLYLVSLSPMEGADLINHSCNPNAGLRGQIALVAMRQILAGEEVTIDYAMCDGTPYDEFPCSCKAEPCRGRITGEDWKRPDLQQRYAGYFSPYLQRRMDRLKSGIP